eukprot:157623_1
MATPLSTTVLDLFKPLKCVISDNIYAFLHIYDRSTLATICRPCLTAFIQYLQNIAADEQLSAKSFALRQFILRPGQEAAFYPITYLHELKKVGAVLYPASSPEFVGKLRKALYHDDKVTLKVLIDFGVDASKIMIDILRKNFDCSQDILRIVFSSKTIDLNYNHYRARYPLMLAAIWTNKLDIWEVLKDHPAIDWDFTDKQGRNLAYWATCCRTQNTHKFLEICRVKNVNMDHKDHNGNRPLCIAVGHRKLDVVKYLVDDCKVDINAQNGTGLTVAHDVCERAYAEILEYLIGKGLKLNIQNNTNETAIDYARMYYSQDIIDVLRVHKLWT